MAAMIFLLNGQVSTCVLSKLDVTHSNLELARNLSSRKFSTLRLDGGIAGVRNPDEIPREADRGDSQVQVTRRRRVGRYLMRCEGYPPLPAPKTAHPWYQPAPGIAGSWEKWATRRSYCDWGAFGNPKTPRARQISRLSPAS